MQRLDRVCAGRERRLAGVRAGHDARPQDVCPCRGLGPRRGMTCAAMAKAVKRVEILAKINALRRLVVVRDGAWEPRWQTSILF